MALSRFGRSTWKMLISKDCKMAVVYSNKEIVQRMAVYFPYRSSVIHNFQSQLSKGTDELEPKQAQKRRKQRKISQPSEMQWRGTICFPLIQLQGFYWEIPSDHLMHLQHNKMLQHWASWAHQKGIPWHTEPEINKTASIEHLFKNKAN